MKMHLIFAAALALALTPALGNAAMVSTFVTGVSGVSSMAFDAAGDLFAGQRSPVSRIVKITPAGVISTFATGIGDPLGLVFDSSGNLFVTNCGGNTINKVTPAGEVSLFVSGITSPFGIAVDRADNLYVAEYFSQTLKKVTPARVITTVATAVGPAGMRSTCVVREESGDIYVGTIFGTVVTCVTPAGVKSTFARVPAGIAAMAMGPDGNWYVGGYMTQKILAITPTGVCTVVAGTGAAGNLDGPALSATFNRPYGVAFASDGRLFIGDNLSGRIRILDTDPPVVPVTPTSWSHLKQVYR